MSRVVESHGVHVFDNPSLVEYDDSVGNHPGQAQVVGDQDDRGAALASSLVDRIDELVLSEHVQPAGRFVG